MIELFYQVNDTGDTYLMVTKDGVRFQFTEVENNLKQAMDNYIATLKSDEEVVKEKLVDLLETKLTEDELVENVEIFPQWKPNMDMVEGKHYQDNGILYKVIQGHTSQSDWTPEDTPALFQRISKVEEAEDEYKPFIQPTGGHDAYMTGDKVLYNEKKYVSKIDNNVWTPDEYPAGWELVEETTDGN